MSFRCTLGHTVNYEGVSVTVFEKKQMKFNLRYLLPSSVCTLQTLYTSRSSSSSSLAKVPVRFSPLPLGGFRQVFKLSANMRLTLFASYMLVLGSLVTFTFAGIYQRSTGWAYDEVFTTYKPCST